MAPRYFVWVKLDSISNSGSLLFRVDHITIPDYFFLITKVLSISVTSDGYDFDGIRSKLLEINTKFKDLFSTMFAVQLLRDRYSKSICLFIQLYGLKITHTKQRGTKKIK